MALYAQDTDGATCCMECIHGLCITRGHICEAEHCQCDCRREADRAQEADDREPDKLAVIANELDRERYDVEQLMTERFGRPRRSAA